LTRARSEDGIALLSAIIIMFALLMLGLGMAAFSDAQSRAAGVEQGSEAAYSLAEAALNAQIFQLSQRWVTATTPDASVCTPANAASTAGCPDPTSLAYAYPRTGPATCVGGMPTDAWGSPAGTQWATYVRDDGPQTTTAQLFESATDETQPAYDANGNGSVWVRAVGVANCRMVVVIAKASEQLLPISFFPQFVLNANGFEVSNSGKKTELDAKGNAPQPSYISVRCAGLSGPGAQTSCTNYSNSQQIASGPNYANPPASSPAISPSQLAAFKATAVANNTYWPVGQCPTSMSQLAGPAGVPTYIEGPCNLSFTGGTAYSQSQPGFLVLANGTLALNGNATFYGVIYALNSQGCPTGSSTTCPNGSDVVWIHGGGQVVGAVDVDGNGTVNLGDTGGANTNLKYDPTAFQTTKVLGGAAQTPNTFRILPAGQ